MIWVLFVHVDTMGLLEKKTAFRVVHSSRCSIVLDDCSRLVIRDMSGKKCSLSLFSAVLNICLNRE